MTARSGPTARLRTGPKTRVALFVGVLAVIASTAVVTLAGNASAATTLGASAAERGRYFGTAVAAEQARATARTRTILNREFNMVTPENEMKMDATEPSQNQFSYGAADQIVNRASAAAACGCAGHTLAWHSQQPGWMQNMSRHRAAQRHAQPRHPGRDPLPGQDLRLGRGQRGVRRRQQRRPARLEPAAHRQRLDRGGVPGRPRRRPERQALLQRLQHRQLERTPRPRPSTAWCRTSSSRGVPIDCVGFQSHFNSGSPYPSNYRTTLSSFAALGVDVQITELDIEGSGTAQANTYRNVVNDCLAVARCNGITVWGIRDSDSWRSSGTPLLFDGNGNKKPAYDAVLSALNSRHADDRRLAPSTVHRRTAPAASVRTPPPGCRRLHGERQRRAVVVGPVQREPLGHRVQHLDRHHQAQRQPDPAEQLAGQRDRQRPDPDRDPERRRQQLRHHGVAQRQQHPAHRDLLGRWWHGPPAAAATARSASAPGSRGRTGST